MSDILWLPQKTRDEIAGMKEYDRVAAEFRYRMEQAPTVRGKVNGRIHYAKLDADGTPFMMDHADRGNADQEWETTQCSTWGAVDPAWERDETHG